MCRTCQFIGAGQHKYAHELMEVQCGFKAEYSANLQQIVMRNWLLNPSGKPGKWYPVDQYQEMIVYHLKQLDTPDSSQNLKAYHRECLAPLVLFLLDFKHEMRDVVLGTKWGGHHTARCKAVDIRALVDKMRPDRAFHFRPGREAPGTQAKDWIQLGRTQLVDPRYWNNFLQRSLRSSISAPPMEPDGPVVALTFVD
jgi:hypothetical protein